MNRRQMILSSLAASVTSVSTAASTATAAEESPLHVATNTYPWGTFYQREGKKFVVHSDEALAAIARTGIRGYEPAIGAVAEFDGLGDRLKKHGLEMRSLYVNSELHEEAAGEASLRRILEIARAAALVGAKIIVTNPSPLQWGGGASKNDSQLACQAKWLDAVGKGLREMGLVLAYHNHDMELKEGAREFHHMLTSTGAENVKFCLDLHWVYRGCGNSQLALFDVIKHYGSRVVELHLRQSKAGKWQEVFTAQGDIDHVQAVELLKAAGANPHIVLEQAVEAGSPQTMDAEAAHAASLAKVIKTFSGLKMTVH